MSKCPPLEVIFQYLDSELKGKEEKSFLDHLRSCGKCREKLEEARKLNSLLFALEEKATIEKHNNLFAGCLKTEALLNYLHDRLTLEEAEVVKKHLGKCHRCTEELELIRESEASIDKKRRF